MTSVVRAGGGPQLRPSIEFWVALVLSLMGVVAFSTLALNVCAGQLEQVSSWMSHRKGTKQ